MSLPMIAQSESILVEYSIMHDVVEIEDTDEFLASNQIADDLPELLHLAAEAGESDDWH